MEHPQTVLLGKVLQSNIALGNAYVNNSEHSKIVSRWMDLQQSVNILFDSKHAMGEFGCSSLGFTNASPSIGIQSLYNLFAELCSHIYLCSIIL